MRRLDVRPFKKLRNPARHLRAMARWPARVAANLPTNTDLVGERFWNFKIGAYSKLIEPPHATPEAQRAAFAALFAAAEAVEQSPGRPANIRIAVLATTPFLFQSEVTLFADEDYFQSFLRAGGKRTAMGEGWVEDQAVSDTSFIASILPPTPTGLSFMGAVKLREFDPEWGGEPVERITWVWAYPRR